ncbi:dockerin type I domain-containing protein [Blastopirellula marina]|uniref:dockerin type I domain-containing protein n=1 Tax=Blastopirellula marina TaxID=124 RepID=UPI0011B03C58|nr:dockerin type I domain-containing protein [Blastopirellula marina]
MESRINLSGVPFGADATDTGEYMLGDISVTVVFLESKQSGGVDASTEDWTQAEIDANKAKVDEALQWWVDTFELQNSVHELNFHVNYQYADNPVPTNYEAISRPATDFDKWVGDFLNYVSAERTGDIVKDIRLYNNSRRVAEGTNWAFTIFVADSSNDSDGYWGNPGSIAGGFSIAGGAFLALPSSRGAITIAHETAHQFWAMDEYSGSKDYFSHRGYYDTQNTNAVLNNPDSSQIVDSLMLSGQQMQNAYDNHTSSTSMFETIGWKDSDGDGIFDVLDQPLSLTGTGALDADTLEYRFVGQAAVGILPNLNPAGVQQSQNQFLQNDITINTVAAVQYRIDGGAWQTAQTYDQYVADIDISIAMPDSANHVVEIRAIDATGAIFSETFSGLTSEIAPTAALGANGFLFDDQNRNGVFDLGEAGLAGWMVELVDGQSMPLETQLIVEPDDYSVGSDIADVPGATFTAFGDNITTFSNVFSLSNASATTGDQVFGYYRSVGAVGTYSDWNTLQQLQIDLDAPVSRVSIDAIGVANGSIGRLDAYDAAGNLIARYTTDELTAGQAETMSVELASPEIVKIVVAGQLGTSVRLDNFIAGRPAVVETDAFGAFSLPIDVVGDYQLRVTPPQGDSQTYFIQGSGDASFALAPLTGFQFAIKLESLLWTNPLASGDINDDGVIDSTDFDLVLAELASPTYTTNGQFLADHSYPAPYLDANGDGEFDLLDVKRVLEAVLTAQLGTPQEGESVTPANSLVEGSSTPATSGAGTTSSEDFLLSSDSSKDSAVTSGSTTSDSTAETTTFSQASITSTSGYDDLGLGNLASSAVTESEQSDVEGELVVDATPTAEISSDLLASDDPILAVAADDLYLAIGQDDEESESDSLDPWLGFWDLLD